MSCTNLSFKVVKGNKPITAIRELVKAEADIKARNSNGQNALFCAVLDCYSDETKNAAA